MNTRTKIVPRKNKLQMDYEKVTFINPLKERIPRATSGRPRSIKLPKYIEFKIIEGKTLHMYIQHQGKIDSNIHNPVCDNMQSDNVAFEGWAVVLKAWLPDKVDKVILSWDKPKIGEKDNLHYNRFLYRCLNFKHDYAWFEIHEKNEDELISFQEKFESGKLSINISGKNPDKKTKAGENSVEYEFVDKNKPNVREKFIDRYGLNILNHQLHVGILRNDKQFFPGDQSAIDIWGVNNISKSAFIYELKYIDSSKKAKNMKVGIISELYFYAALIRDVILGHITPKSLTSITIENERNFYEHSHGLKAINAIMLANEFHPLLCNNDVLSILNDNNSLYGVQIIFEETEYEYKAGSYNFSFK